MRSAAFSAIMIVGAFVSPRGTWSVSPTQHRPHAYIVRMPSTRNTASTYCSHRAGSDCVRGCARVAGIQVDDVRVRGGSRDREVVLAAASRSRLPADVEGDANAVDRHAADVLLGRQVVVEDPWPRVRQWPRAARPARWRPRLDQRRADDVAVVLQRGSSMGFLIGAGSRQVDRMSGASSWDACERRCLPPRDWRRAGAGALRVRRGRCSPASIAERTSSPRSVSHPTETSGWSCRFRLMGRLAAARSRAPELVRRPKTHKSRSCGDSVGPGETTTPARRRRDPRASFRSSSTPIA